VVRRGPGDRAFERGTDAITPKAGGEPMQDIGKYATIHQRQPGGAWCLARGIWSSNNLAFIPR
jgi:hypothetical protein